MTERLRRSGPGLWGLAVLSAVVVPVLAEVAAVHRGHWAGAATGPFWASVVVPWAGRTWTFLVVMALAGWAASAAPAHPRVGRRIAGGVVAGAGGALVCALAAMPGWIWLARLGAAAPGTLAVAYGAGFAALLCSGVVAGASAPGIGEPGGAAVGAVSGGALLWATWGVALG